MYEGRLGFTFARSGRKEGNPANCRDPIRVVVLFLWLSKNFDVKESLFARLSADAFLLKSHRPPVPRRAGASRSGRSNKRGVG